MRIHSGKSVERVKTEIAEAAQRRMKAENSKRNMRLNLRLGLEEHLKTESPARPLKCSHIIEVSGEGQPMAELIDLEKRRLVTAGDS